jgi:non-ribosomal peptide synthetase component E (peptide arylation enzyme)
LWAFVGLLTAPNGSPSGTALGAGPVPIAYVTFAPGTAASEDELKAFLSTQIAEFKIPVRILAIDHMPLTHSCKIDHKVLSQRYTAKR